MPVLMLTARDDEADVLAGLGVGANDGWPRGTRGDGGSNSGHAAGPGGGGLWVEGAARPAPPVAHRGRIGGKALKPASYRLSGQATEPARNASAVRQKTFRIVK